jgi:peptide/nickel transport system permease protein
MSMLDEQTIQPRFEPRSTRPAPTLGRRWRRLYTSVPGLLGLMLIGLFVLVAVLAPRLAPYSPTDGDLSTIRPGFVPGPSAEHPLGLDQQGRDELSRLLYGARSSLLIGVVSVSIGTLVGGLLGTLAGLRAGWVDTLIMRLTDVMLAIPGLLLAVGLAALLGPSLLSVMVAIGSAGIPTIARMVRGSLIVEREREHVVAARAIGASSWRIATSHLLPGAVGPALVAATLSLGSAILAAAGLAFLGIGVNDPSIPEWGRMLAESERVLVTSPQLVLFPGVAIAVTVLGCNLLGEALRDAMEEPDGGSV